MSHVRLRGVSRHFATTTGGRLTAVGPVDLEVRSGEFVCVVGPSGCGKTTLLHLVAGLDRPDTGEVTIDGRVVDGPAPDRLVIFQDGGLFPWLDVRGNIEFGLRRFRLTEAERRRRSDALIEKVRLTGFASARVHQLSGGMRQRVALARGLAVEPGLLLMDEPFAALDAQTRDLLGFELQQIWRETRQTILFITHNLREAACLGDRILVMSHRPGRITRDIPIDLPRPRRIEDEGLIERIRPIMADLRAESPAPGGAP